MGPNLGADEVAALRFIIQEQKDQINSEKQILERHREEASASSRRHGNLSSHHSSSIPQRTRSHLPLGGDTHNITRNLEAEFNEVDILPKTREAAIMATAAYIAANARSNDEHMRHLRSLALEGVRVLQSMNEQGHDTTPCRNIPTVEQSRHQAVTPVVVPRPEVIEPINGELRHGLVIHRKNIYNF
jgi:hypothetical protein